MVQMSGGEALAKSLVGEGVEVAFGLPGIQICGIVAALRDEPGIRMVTTRHEQATKYMADGYAATPSRQESQVWRWWSPRSGPLQRRVWSYQRIFSVHARSYHRGPSAAMCNRQEPWGSARNREPVRHSTLCIQVAATGI